jgi:Leucine-rich repeat (LRR) protein
MHYIQNLNKRVRVLILLLVLNAFALTQLSAQETYNLQTDSLALVDLYNSTNGPGWTYKTNWLTGSVKTWYGVTVTNARVTNLEFYIYGNNLNGTLPASLGNLTALKSLLLVNNSKLIGSIPTEIGNLTALQTLKLHNTSLEGPIPVEIGNLTALQTLYLSGTLSGSIPSSIGNLSALKEFYLYGSGTSITGSIPVEIGNLTNLESLTLCFTGLSGQIPGQLCNLRKLKKMYLSGNSSLNGPIPTEIGSLTNMETLSIRSCGLSGAIPASIGNLNVLQTLDLSNNKLSGTIPPEIGNLTALKYLTLSGNQLNGEIPMEIGNLPVLENLILNGNKFTGQIPISIGNLLAIKTIYLGNNQLNRSIPIEIGNLKTLENLDLGSNKLTGQIPVEFGNLLSLKTLSISNDSISGQIPSSLGNLKALEYLGLSNNKLTGSIPTEIGNLPVLRSLDLSVNKLTGSIPTSIGSLTKLTTLDLSSNQLSGQIPTVIGNLTALQRLWLSCNSLNGLIPKEIGNLTKLSDLTLGLNQLSGSIPAEIGNLIALRFLNLALNKLTGSIPSSIGNLTQMVWMELYSNQLSGAIPNEIANLQKLTILSLYENQFIDLPTISAELTTSWFYRNGVHSNCLTFDDIIPNQTWIVSYSPQKNIGTPKTSHVTIGNPYSIDLGIDPSLTTNVYKWYKNGVLYTTTNNNKLVFSSIQQSNTGVYTCSVTNPAVSGLTLTSNPDTIVVENLQIKTQPVSVTQCAGTNTTFAVEVTSSTAITYSWRKNGMPIENTNNATFTLNNLSAADAGDYDVVITNPYNSSITSNAATLTVNTTAPQVSLSIEASSNDICTGSTISYMASPINGGTTPIYNWKVNGITVGDNSETYAYYPAHNDVVSCELTSNENCVTGNPATASIIVHDNVAPRVIAKDITVQLDATGKVSIVAADIDNGSSDACGIASLSVSKTDFDCNNIGTNAVILTVTDTNGNSTTATANVTVQDNIAPQLTTPVNIVQLNDAGLCGANVTLGQAVATDNCTVASLTNNAPAFFPVGVTTVTWTATDANGNATTALQTVEITNNTPVISNMLVTAQPQSVNNAIASATHDDNNLVSASWNWGDGSTSASIILGDQISGIHVYTKKGAFDVTLSVADACGKTDTKVFNYVKPYTPLETDSLALVALYNATNGPNWTKRYNWLTGRLNTWFGVKISENRVTEIEFGFGNNLVGYLPPELGNLSKLTFLSIMDNPQLSGFIPSELGRLSNLTGLRLCNNKFSGIIPSELGALSSLAYLNLSQNQLNGSIPPTLGNLFNLTTLSLGNNQLNGSIPPALGNLSNLTTFYLGSNQLSGPIPKELGNLTNLTNLNLGQNQLSGTIPLELGRLTNLVSLFLIQNQLSGSIPKELGNLSKLVELYIYNNQLSGSLPPELGLLSKLATLYSSSNRLSGSIPKEFGGLLSLVNLYLDGNQLSGSIPPELGNLSKLQVLFLRNNQLSGSIPPELGNLSNLNNLNLRNNQLSGSIPPELGNLLNLDALYLGSNKLTGSIPKELGSLSKLRYLYLINNQLSGPIPSELSNLSGLAGFQLYENKFGFDDIASSSFLPNEIVSFQYAPQKKQPAPTQTSVGKVVTLTVSDNHPANHYTWYVNNVAIAGNDSRSYTFTPTAITNVYAKITNDVYTDESSTNYIIYDGVYTPPGNANQNLVLQTETLMVAPIVDRTSPTVIVRDITIQLNESGVATITAAQIDNGSNDEFGITSITVSKNNFNCSNVGVNTVTLTVTDTSGNASTGSATITVQDNIAPVAIAQNITIELDATGKASITADQINNGSTDACGIASLSVSKTAFDCSNVGTNAVTLTVTDVHGNASTGSATITVQDNVAPVAIAQNVTIELDATGVASITAAQINNGSTDACGIASLSVSKTAFDCSNVGTNAVALTVTDVHGNISTADAVATVQDNIAPVAIAKNVTIELDGTGKASITADQINNGSTDACGIASLSVSKTDFDCSNVGTNAVTLTVTDAHGNVSTAEAIVTVQDNIAPVAIAQNITIELDATGAASITADQINNGSTDACGIASLSVSKTDFDCSNVGTNAVTLTVTDVHGNISTADAVVTVQDNIAPVAIAQNVTIELDATGKASITADQINNGSTDACGIASLSVSKTAFDFSNVGTNTVTLTVTDVHGNISTADAVVTVQDNIAPVAIAQNVTIELDATGKASITADQINNGSTDVCGIASSSVSKTDFDCSNVGTNAVTLTVTDVHGNISTADAVVTVQDNIAPVAIAQNVTIELDATGAASITADQINNGSNDACGIASLSVSKTDFDCSNVGTNAVALTVTDVHGNISTADAVVTVQDNIAPVAIAQNVTIELDATGKASITADQINNGSTDACGIASLSVSKTAFDFSNVGTNTVTLTVIDISGNSSTVDAVVTVQGIIPPVPIAKDITIQLNASGVASIVAADVDNGSNAAGGIASLALDKTSFDCSNVGANTVTLTVTNNYGIVSSVTATVTVQDKIAPSLIVPANIVRLNDIGICGAVVNIGKAVATDNCGIASITNNAPAFFPVGITTVTWSAVDTNGNATTSKQTVEITNKFPVIQDLTLSSQAKQGVVVTASANHTDNNLVVATYNWGDGSSTVAIITGSQIKGSHVYSQAGFYNVTLTIEDACGKTDTETYNDMAIYNPCNGFVTGGGYITTPKGAYSDNTTLTGKSNYGFEVKYEKNSTVPTGEFNFHFNAAKLKVKATSFEWLMINNDMALIKGHATVNDGSGYQFIASIVDGDITGKKGSDFLRLIVWDNSGNVLYDNQNGDMDRARASKSIATGQIVIHKFKNGNCFGDDYDHKDEDDHNCDMNDKDEDDHHANDHSCDKDNKDKNITVKLTPVQIDMTVYPNPVVNNEVNIYVENFDNTMAKIDLTSSTGQLVYSNQSVKFINGRSKLDFKQAKLKSGNYLLRVTEISTARFGVKQIVVSCNK